MKGYRSNLIKVIAFITITTLFSTVVGLTMGKIKIQDTDDYHAVFTDVSGLKSGVDVRAAGVSLGTVSSLKLQKDNTVKVKFNVPTDVPITSNMRAKVRYANLTGDRYVDLTANPADPGRRLPPGSTIPVDRTAPALNLDDLYGGFQPLLQALSPTEVNELTSNIIAVTEGQGEAVESLLGNVGSFTSAIAERDELIGSVIANLNTVLGTVDARRGELDRLVVGLDDLLAGLSADRQAIGQDLVRVNRLAKDVSESIEQIRPGFAGALKETGVVTKTLAGDLDTLNEVLVKFPEVMRKLHRGGAYGSFFNFYICGIRFKFTSTELGTPVFSPFVTSTEKRCDPNFNESEVQ